MRRFPIVVAAALAAATCVTCGTNLLPLWSGSDGNVAARERASIKQCGTGELTADGAKRITRQPYLQATTTTGTVIAFGAVDGKGEVVLREPGADGKVVATVPAKYAGEPSRGKARLAAQREGASIDSLGADSIYVMQAELSRLEPGHLYCYQITGADGVALTQPAPMVTAAPADTKDPIRFVVLGDTGTGGAAQLGVLHRMAAEPFDFMLFVGDIAYMAGKPDELQKNYFNVYRDLLKFVPAYPAIGNHERRTEQGRPWFEAFVLPGAERYYSFDWGPVHFVAIDTTHPDAKQLDWLQADLQATKQPWKIVFGHHAFYTNAMRGRQVGIREAFAKIVTDNKVDLVINGHEHQYERFRIANVNYIVTGGGGGQLHKFGGKSQALAQATVHHFLAVEATATKIAIRAVDIDGKQIEKVELDKPVPVPDAKAKVKVDGKPDEQQNPVAPEQKVVPDEKLHDEPDDDKDKPKADPKTPKGKREPIKENKPNPPVASHP